MSEKKTEKGWLVELPEFDNHDEGNFQTGFTPLKTIFTEKEDAEEEAARQDRAQLRTMLTDNFTDWIEEGDESHLTDARDKFAALPEEKQRAFAAVALDGVDPDAWIGNVEEGWFKPRLTTGGNFRPSKEEMELLWEVLGHAVRKCQVVEVEYSRKGGGS